MIVFTWCIFLCCQTQLFLFIMTLLLRNLQKAVSVNVPKLKQDVQSLRRIMHVQRFDVAVLCVDDNKIQELNKMYRGVDKVTDVLSFPANEVWKIHSILL